MANQVCSTAAAADDDNNGDKDDGHYVYDGDNDDDDDNNDGDNDNDGDGLDDSGSDSDGEGDGYCDPNGAQNNVFKLHVPSCVQVPVSLIPCVVQKQALFKCKIGSNVPAGQCVSQFP